MHTCYDLSIAFDLRPDVSQQVIDTLEYMTRTSDYEFYNAPDNSIFRGNFWRDMLQQNKDGFAYFPGNGHAIIARIAHQSDADATPEPENNQYTFSFRCEVIDTVGEFFAFLEWLSQYSATQGFVGYWYPLDKDHPLLIYFRDSNVFVSSVAPNPIGIRGHEPW